MPVLPPRVSGPDWMVRGHSFAHDTRCAAVGNLLMSSPISARITCATFGPDAGDLVEAIHSAKRGVGHGVGRRAGGQAAGVRVDGLGVGHRRQQLIDAGRQGVDLGGQASIWSSSIRASSA